MADETTSTPLPMPDIDTIAAAQGINVAAMVDQALQLSLIPPVSTAIGDALFGINATQTPPPISINKDFHGFTFFTRPLFNLSDENLRSQRKFTPLLTNNAQSYGRIIRCLLDPTLAAAGITSPFVDPQQAFISPLTNFMISSSGWPDLDAQTFTAPEGVYKETYSMVDGTVLPRSTYDITTAFRNISGDPLTVLFYYWQVYMEKVTLGEMVPYPDKIINNEIDYNTRIYRLILDVTKTKVQKIAACGAAFPLNAPIGASFNYSNERPMNNANDEISITFRMIGAEYLDDILIDEFNRTVGFFNANMVPSVFTTDPTTGVSTNGSYTQVPLGALAIFNNKVYPRINPVNYNLEWWCDTAEYQYRLPALTALQQLKPNIALPSGV